MTAMSAWIDWYSFVPLSDSKSRNLPFANWLKYRRHACRSSRADAVSQCVSPVLVSADGCEDGLALPRRVRCRLDYMRSVLPDHAACRLRLRPSARKNI